MFDLPYIAWHCLSGCSTTRGWHWCRPINLLTFNFSVFLVFSSSFLWTTLEISVNMDITDLSGPLYTVHRGDTLYILLGSSGVSPLLPGTMAHATNQGEQGGKNEEDEQTMSYMDKYYPQPTLEYRRHSVHQVTPRDMSISGTGWNATWRSVHSDRPLARTQKYTGGSYHIHL
jgi:hypothetical protein